MIKSFSFKNYKSFKDGKIELRPITILLGANSVGKSSILQLLSMIKQTVNIDKQYKSALKLNGEFVSLGENKNIFHNQNTSTPLEITFEINEFDISFIKSDLKDRLIEILMNFDRIYSFFSIENSDRRLLVQRYLKGDSKYLIDKIQSIKSKINNQLRKIGGEEDIEAYLEKILGDYRHGRNFYIFYSKEDNKINLQLNHYRKTLKLLDKLSAESGDKVYLSYQIVVVKEELKLRKIEIKTEDNVIVLGYSQDVGRIKHDLYSDILDNKDLKIYKGKFGNSIYFEKLRIVSRDYRAGQRRSQKNYWYNDVVHRRVDVEKNIYVETIYSIFAKTISSVLKNFDSNNINYVSPLRAYPKRYYFLDEANVSSSLNTIDGNQLTEILKEDKKIKTLVNNWLKKFKLKVDVSNLADVIHNIKINQHGLNLDITDVGFGLSQVLPVIVQGFLSHESSLTIIEQPEIHLHPKMQADLADLFIDVVLSKEDKNKNLLIETHSEYLLKRLRRRIAEGVIPAESVSIYFVHPKDSNTKSGKIEKLDISNTGKFDWPKDFYSADVEDTIEFLKHQE